MSYIDYHPLGVLSTISQGNESPHGAVVYVCTGDGGYVYFLTKAGTRKYQNLVQHPMVSLTFYDAEENSTLQLAGRASEVNNAVTIDTAMKKITRAHSAAAEWLPPIAKLRAGNYVLIGIHLTVARLAEYQHASIGDEYIFTEP